MYEFYNGQRLQKGDILLIPFGSVGNPTRVKVLRSEKRKNFLKVRVIKDTYVGFGPKDSWKRGQILNIGTEIYTGDWCFTKELK